MNERERKQHIINLALEEYLNTPEEERSLTKLGEKYGVKRQTLSIYKRNTGVIATELNMVGTENFLKTINHIFKDKGYISNKSCDNWDNKAFQLKFSFVPSRKIARYLYENANIYLERKYNKYLEFCSLEDESLLRKSSKIGESCDGNTEVNSEIAKGSESLLSVESE